MAIWLGLLIFVVVVFILYSGSKRIEGFGELQRAQSEFGNYQNTYFHDQVEKGVLTNPGLNLGALNDAAAQPDLLLSKTPADDMTRFFVEDPENAFKEEDLNTCRIVTHPRFLPTRKAGARIGCGWYFYESPEKMSVGALGTRDGPVLPTGLRGGEWIWNREVAIRREEIKRCKTLRRCELLELNEATDGCGFCPDKGHGVPINDDDTLKYPDDTAGSCGSEVITDADDCYKPVEEGGAGAASSARALGGGAALVGSIDANTCIQNGILSVSCFKDALGRLGFSSKGGIFKLIDVPTADPMAANALKKIGETEIDLDDSTWKTRNLETIKKEWNNFEQLAYLARLRNGSLESRAARYLVDGTPYTPCDTYTADKKGPFEDECVQQAFRKAGCQAGGAANPTSRAAISELTNLTWGQVNSKFRKIYDEMKSSDPRTQDMALKNCLGVGAEFKRETGNTCWKCADGINAPIRRNAKGDIECASLDGYNCLMQTNKANCDFSIGRLAQQTVKPLTCGTDHKRKLRTDGYSTPGHWCARAVAGGAHNGPLEAK